jgi:hypothetical protein
MRLPQPDTDANTVMATIVVTPLLTVLAVFVALCSLRILLHWLSR